jgi:hypothetical protein
MENAVRGVEKVTGVPNVVYDVLAVLTETLEGVAPLEVYKLDAPDADDQQALELFEGIQQQQKEQINNLKAFIKQRLE